MDAKFHKSVMVVSENSSRNQALIRIAVKELQYDNVHIANKTTEAMELLLDDVGDIAIIDLENKSFDGVEAVRKIKAMRSEKRTPVFVTSEVATAQRIMELRVAGADGYILKPLTPNAILKQIMGSAATRSREIMNRFAKDTQEITSQGDDLPTEWGARMDTIGRTIGELHKETSAFHWYARNFVDIGKLFQQSGNGAKGIPYLERAITLDNSANSVEPHELLAEQYKSIGDYARAIRHIQLAIQKQKKTEHRQLIKYGELQLKSGAITAAIETFTKAVAHIEGEQGATAGAAELSDTLTHRGIAYREKGERDDDTVSLRRAVQDLQRSIHLTSSVIAAHYNLMLTYKKLGDEQRAMETLEKIKAIEPVDCDGWVTMADAYFQSGELVKTSFALGKARKAAGYDIGSLKRVLDKFIAYNMLDKAEVILKELQQAAPQETCFYNMMGILYRRQGKIEPAIEQYNKAIGLDPGDAALFFNLGRALRDFGKKDESVKVFQKCLELDPDMEDAKKLLAV